MARSKKQDPTSPDMPVEVVDIARVNRRKLPFLAYQDDTVVKTAPVIGDYAFDVKLTLFMRALVVGTLKIPTGVVTRMASTGRTQVLVRVMYAYQPAGGVGEVGTGLFGTIVFMGPESVKKLPKKLKPGSVIDCAPRGNLRYGTKGALLTVFNDSDVVLGGQAPSVMFS